MEQETEIITPEVQSFIDQVLIFANSLLLPSRLIQVGILIAILALAWGINYFVAPRIHNWMRGLDGRPKWQLRWMLILHRRIKLMLFILLTGAALIVMRDILGLFPSRYRLIAICAAISFAWFVIALLAQVIRNSFLRRIVRLGGWTYVVLYYLGFIEATMAVLDNLAIEFGDFRLSLYAILKALVITGILFVAARLIATTSTNKIRENKDISPSMQVLAAKFLQLLLYGAAFFIGLKAVGFDLTGLAVLSGAIGVGIGFGLQKVVSNLISGVIILLDKSIKPGDVISLGDTFGWIDSLGARYVSVVTRDGREYLIPNEDLITGQVVNWSHSNDLVRLDIYFGTAYSDDPHDVRRIAIEAAKSVDRVLSWKAPVCHIVGFGDSSVDYILRFWITDPTGGLTNIRGNVYLALWDAFQANNINIPFPQREVRLLNDKDENPDKPVVAD